MIFIFKAVVFCVVIAGVAAFIKRFGPSESVLNDKDFDA